MGAKEAVEISIGNNSFCLVEIGSFLKLKCGDIGNGSEGFLENARAVGVRLGNATETFIGQPFFVRMFCFYLCFEAFIKKVAAFQVFRF